ncbi:hypothetical protein FACS1894189_5720 [Planctomycetales bacterium]|nr:hypothetical protein FACS1894189_5720 [Planctomycetales bacterium]
MLIITADDLGFSPSRNQAILQAASAGTLSAASLMVNMPEAENAAKDVHNQTPQLDLGLHFTLTSGRAVADVPLLTDSDGMFRHGFLSLWNNAAKPEFLEQIRIEFAAQLRLMDDLEKRYGLRVGHLDSHQHIHAIKPIWNILAATAKERESILRFPHEPYGSLSRLVPFRTFSPAGDLKKMILDFCLRNIEPVPKRLTALYFGLLDSGKMDRSAWNRILNVIRRLPVIRCEVNVHPGLFSGNEATAEPLCCSKDDRNFHQSIWRRRELDVLLDPAFADLLQTALADRFNTVNN